MVGVVAEGWFECGDLVGIVWGRARVGAGCYCVGVGRVSDSYCWCVWGFGDDVGCVVRGCGVVDWLVGSYGDVREVFWVVVAGVLGGVAGFGWVVGEDGIVKITKLRVFGSVCGCRVKVGTRPTGHRCR